MTALFLLPALLFGSPAVAGRGVAPVVYEVARTAPAPARLSAIERDALRAAEQAVTRDLRAVRGGDITNSELTTVFLVLGIIVLLVILL